MIVFHRRSGVFSLLLLFASAMASATTVPAAAAAQSRPTVESLAFQGQDNGVEFTITPSEAVMYTYFILDGPRLVLDLHGTENQLDFERRDVDLGGVESVRAFQFEDETRRSTRVVFDLEKVVSYDVHRADDGMMTVSFGGDYRARTIPPVETEAETQVASSEATEPAVEEEVAVSVAVAEPIVEEAPVAEAVEQAAEIEVIVDGAPGFVAETAEVVEAVETAEVVETPEIAEAGIFLPSPVGEPTITLGEVQDPAPIPNPVAAPAVARLPVVNVNLPRAVAAAPPAATAFLAQQGVVAPTETQYTGEIVSFNLVGSDLRDFFRVIAELSGLNIILDDTVTGELTLVLNDVPWDQALDIVLRTNNLGYELMGNVLRIAPRTVLAAEDANERQLREDQALNVPLETRPFILSYTTGDAVSGLVTPLLSSRGTIVNDPRRNALIITDVPASFERIDSMIAFLDTPAQQVEIEARLLFASKRFSREMGSQFGIVVGNNSQNTFGGAGAAASPFSRTPPPNLSVGTGSGSGGGAAIPLVADFPSNATSGFSFLLGAGTDIILDEIITLAEANGTAKLLSRPRVVTQNNQAATVSQGTQIPVQTNVNNTISVQFIPFNLSLTVTPQITDAGTILLNAQIENSSPDFARSIQGVPSVTTQQAATQVLIPDGGTAVVGGILVDDDSVNVAQIPGLGDIPILGRLFKSTSTVKTTNELLFFITARIKPADPLQFLAGNEQDQSVLFGAIDQ